MGRHTHQYGGTKMSIKDETRNRWVTSNDDNQISMAILMNLCSLKLVSSSSLCSMVLVGMLNPNGNIKKRSQIYQEDGTLNDAIKRAKRPRFENEGKIEPDVCLKISLVGPTNKQDGMIPWSEPGKTKKIMKKITTRDEIVNEVETQKDVALSMLCGENASDIIPDILSQCMMTASEFTRTKQIIYVNSDSYSAAGAAGAAATVPGSSSSIDQQTRTVVEWLDRTANTKNLYVHITFMDYIEGFTTVKEFFHSKPPPRDLKIQEISCKALAVILILLFKGRIMSWDFHSSNLLTNGTNVKGIDLGRVYKLGITNDDERITKDRRQIKQFAYVDFFKKKKQSYEYEPFKHFFNLTSIVPDKTSKNLERFNDDFIRLLVDLPKRCV